MPSGESADILRAISRYVPARDIDAAAGALEYTTLMLDGHAGRDDLARWCYEFAAAGIPLQDWPAMACARAADGDDTDPETRAIRREALAQALIDRGEMETINRRHRTGSPPP